MSQDTATASRAPRTVDDSRLSKQGHRGLTPHRIIREPTVHTKNPNIYRAAERFQLRYHVDVESSETWRCILWPFLTPATTLRLHFASDLLNNDQTALVDLIVEILLLLGVVLEVVGCWDRGVVAIHLFLREGEVWHERLLRFLHRVSFCHGHIAAFSCPPARR